MNKTFPALEQTWRWFGPIDPIPLSHIRQAGATGVVTALHHLRCGVVWPVEEIRKHIAELEANGLRWSVVESVAVHEDIKQAKGDCAKYLANYAQTLRNLAACGVKIVCYNFMPLLDWTRTRLDWPMADGSEALRFDAIDAAIFDLHILARKGAEKDHSAEVRVKAEQRFKSMAPADKDVIARTILLGLPGTVDDLTLEEFRAQLAQYSGIDSKKLLENFTAFLRHVIPVAEEVGVKLCIHPDDPPFPIFGLPRIASTEKDLLGVLAAFDAPSNGITFCTGSLGANAVNDLPALFRKVAHRVHFIHLRNVKREADGSFFEDDHLEGSTDMPAVMHAILDELDVREKRWGS